MKAVPELEQPDGDAITMNNDDLATKRAQTIAEDRRIFVCEV
ncbi:hypothetical protein ACLB1R_00700 [Escherichia coli]